MEIQENVPLAPYTTLKVGGPARYLAAVHTVADLEPVRQFAQQTGVPVLVLGHGSNVLVSEAGFAGVVMVNCLRGRTYTPSNDGSIIATFGAGENWDEVVVDTVERGLWGLENLSYIPGTVGATPVQNVGAYGVEVADRIVSVDAWSLASGVSKTFTPAECQFGYRDSYFKTAAGRDWVITSVSFRLSSDKKDAVLGYADLQSFVSSTPNFTQRDLRDEIIRIRSAKFPNWQQVGTAGSFFKNPVITQVQLAALLARYPDVPQYPQPDGSCKVSLGWILDKACGLRGYCAGEVCLSEHQALVLLNHGQSAAAVTDFVASVQARVYEQTSLTIEPEVRFV